MSTHRCLLHTCTCGCKLHIYALRTWQIAYQSPSVPSPPFSLALVVLHRAPQRGRLAAIVKAAHVPPIYWACARHVSVLSPPPAFGELVEIDAEHDDDADDNRLEIRVDVVDGQTTVEDADQECPDKRAQDASFTAEEAGAADDDRGDHDQFVTHAGDHLGGAEPGSQ